MKILVLSPHSDDAVFSCFDHMNGWLRSGHAVHVCTIFSKFTPTILGDDVYRYVMNSGFADVRQFEKARQQEDKMALRYLGAKYITPGLIDGAFKLQNRRGVYPSFNEVFSGRIAKNDNRVQELAHYLKKISVSYDRVISPVGIGFQVDHVITAQVARKVIAPDKLSYFYDVPYYFFLRNWKRRYIYPLMQNRVSLRWITPEKIQCMKLYRSQLGLIIHNNQRVFFREGRLLFPEIVVSPW